MCRACHPTSTPSCAPCTAQVRERSDAGLLCTSCSAACVGTGNRALSASAAACRCTHPPLLQSSWACAPSAPESSSPITARCPGRMARARAAASQPSPPPPWKPAGACTRLGGGVAVAVGDGLVEEQPVPGTPQGHRTMQILMPPSRPLGPDWSFQCQWWWVPSPLHLSALKTTVRCSPRRHSRPLHSPRLRLQLGALNDHLLPVVLDEPKPSSARMPRTPKAPKQRQAAGRKRLSEPGEGRAGD